MDATVQELTREHGALDKLSNRLFVSEIQTQTVLQSGPAMTLRIRSTHS